MTKEAGPDQPKDHPLTNQELREACEFYTSRHTTIDGATGEVIPTLNTPVELWSPDYMAQIDREMMRLTSDLVDEILLANKDL